VERLDSAMLGHSVREADRAARNRRAVCVALDQFLQHLRQRQQAPLARSAPPPPVVPIAQVAPVAVPAEPAWVDGDDEPDSIIASRSPAVADPAAGGYRKYVRVPFKREVEVVGSVGQNRCSDLSIGGMYLETVQMWDVGTELWVRFFLWPEDPAPLQLRAQVVYFDPGVGAGLDFVDPPREVRHSIRRYIEQVLAHER
jgi:hypothetical protein